MVGLSKIDTKSSSQLFSSMRSFATNYMNVYTILNLITLMRSWTALIVLALIGALVRTTAIILA